MDVQAVYQRAIKFATAKHVEQNQFVPGTNLPYVVHLSNVAMEIRLAAQHSANFNLYVAIQLALLHDTLEDTTTTLEELLTEFDYDIAQGVSALTKNETLPKAERMTDSLTRIKALPTEVWAVKLADRITNLQIPPSHWSSSKRSEYKQEAIRILQELKGGNTYLEKRLSTKIKDYEQYILD